MKEYQHYNKSFTLIEILVVVAIVGILSGFIFYTVQNNVSKANIAKSQVFSESIRNNLLLNLVSEWKLDGGTVGSTVLVGDVLDSWGTNNATAIGGDPTVRGSSDCISGSCLEFDGAGDYVEIGTPLSLGEATIGMWITVNDTANSAILKFGASSAYVGFSIINTNSAILYMNTSNYQYFNNLTKYYDGEWHYWNITITGGEITDINNARLSIDGRSQSKGSKSISNDPLAWGTFSIASGGYGFFQGLIDEVQFFDAILSSSQIKQNYLSGLNNLLSQGLISESEYNERISTLQ